MSRRFSIVNCFVCFLLFACSANVFASGKGERDVVELFNRLQLQGKIEYSTFESAIRKFEQVTGKKRPVLTIIDYKQPSTSKRMWVIDMQDETVVHNTYVAHGRNSGMKYATNFSNIVSSRKTSLGVFLTNETYYGRNGYSLRLDGLTPGANDNARRRAIVVHGAHYAEESFIKQTGRLGRSWGCPAVPATLARAIIDTIKSGSVIVASA